MKLYFHFLAYREVIVLFQSNTALFGGIWLVQKIETPNDRLHSGFKKSNGLYFDAEVGLGYKKCQTLLWASNGKAYQRWISIETPNSKWANFPVWRFDPKAKRIVVLAYGGKGMGKCVREHANDCPVKPIDKNANLVYIFKIMLVFINQRSVWLESA